MKKIITLTSAITLFSFIMTQAQQPANAGFENWSQKVLYEDPIPYVDTFNIIFASSNLDDSTNYIGLGSVLYIDDIGVVYMPVNTGDEHSNAAHSVFPNPFSDIAIFTFDNRNSNIHELIIYDMLGNVIMKKENIISGSVMIQRSHLTSGIYQYCINEKQGEKVSASGKLVIE